MSKDKIHWKDVGFKNDRYFCNHAVITRKEFLTTNVYKVTCKNCREKIAIYHKSFTKNYKRIIRMQLRLYKLKMFVLKLRFNLFKIFAYTTWIAMLVWMLTFLIGIIFGVY